VKAETFDDIQVLLEALGKDGAVQILGVLLEGPGTQKDLTGAAHLSSSAVSLRIRDYLQMGLVVRSGTRDPVSIPDSVMPHVEALIRAASSLLVASSLDRADRHSGRSG
jgi:DNA-binding HxlR family transcriptional regulator